MTVELDHLIAAGTLFIAGDVAAVSMLLEPFDRAELLGVVAGSANMLFDTCVLDAVEAFPPPPGWSRTAAKLADAAVAYDADDLATFEMLGAQTLTDPEFGVAAAAVFASLLRTAANVDNCDALTYARRCCLIASTPSPT